MQKANATLKICEQTGMSRIKKTSLKKLKRTKN